MTGRRSRNDSRAARERELLPRLGVSPALGRDFHASDDLLNGPPW